MTSQHPISQKEIEYAASLLRAGKLRGVSYGNGLWAGVERLGRRRRGS